jgi:hypothetical protein
MCALRRQRRCGTVHTIRLEVTVGFQILLELHVIGDRLHTVDRARHPHCAIDIGARAHEAAQLNDALEGLDLDLGYLRPGSWKMAALTLVVMTLSSTYSPVPS